MQTTLLEISYLGSFEEALEILQLVFKCLPDANLKLEPKKCFLFQPKVTYLGLVVSERGISCDYAKIEAVEKWPTPVNKSEEHYILDLIGYYRKFIVNFSAWASSFTKLT